MMTPPMNDRTGRAPGEVGHQSNQRANHTQAVNIGNPIDRLLVGANRFIVRLVVWGLIPSTFAARLINFLGDWSCSDGH